MVCEVLLNAGMGRSELLKLRREGVDCGSNVIRAEKAKSRKRREIPMTGRAREILKETSARLSADMTGDQVSHHDDPPGCKPQRLLLRA
jgi:integrase